MAYVAKLINTGGRDGVSKTTDGKHSFVIKHPENGSQAEGSYNPELLVAAGAGACFNGAFLYHLEEAGKSTEGVEMHIELELITDDNDGEKMLFWRLKPVAPNLSKEELKKFADLADKTCPYAKLFRGEAKYEIILE